MITDAQQQQITNFLVSRKLPSDLILEMKDHFNIQISKDMADKNLTFEESFINAKMIWEKDLKMKRRDFFSFEKLPVIAIKYQRQENLKILKKSILMTLLLVMLHIFGTMILRKEYYFLLNSAIYAVMNGLLPLTIFLTYSALNFKKIFEHQSSKNYKAHIPVFIFVVLFFLMQRNWYLPSNSFKIAFDFINFKSFDSYVFFTSVFRITINYFTIIYLYQIISQRWKENIKLKKIINN